MNHHQQYVYLTILSRHPISAHIFKVTFMKKNKNLKKKKAQT